MNIEQSTVIEFWRAHGGKHPVRSDVWHRLSSAHGNEADRYSRYLCDALSMMVHKPSDCDVMLNLIDAIITGKSRKEEYGLNDTCVTFQPGVAQVNILTEDEYNPPSDRFELMAYRKVVDAWRTFLLLPETGTSKMRVELSASPDIAFNPDVPFKIQALG